MARGQKASIDDDKYFYFTEHLFKQVEHLFEWEGLPTTISSDYIERNLVRNGRILFYEDDLIGKDVLRCEVLGFNRHNHPTQARTFTPNTSNENMDITRNIKRLTDGEQAVEHFNPLEDGVLIENQYLGESCFSIVDFYAKRLTLAQQALDTQLYYANMPYIFPVRDNRSKLSIEKMFSDIETGKPFTIVDSDLLAENKDRAGVPTNIQYLGSDILDTLNELNMKFRESIGIDTAGADKKERLLTDEVNSNSQHTRTVLDIMLLQRQKACTDINAFFGTSIAVGLTGQDEREEEQEDDYGNSDSGTTEPTEDE